MPDFSIPPEFDFGQQFDRGTLQRAMALEPERALLSMQVDGPVLHTRVQGSSDGAYEQTIELPVDRLLGLRVQGRCTCPVGHNCKHVAAALMAFEAHQIRQHKNPSAASADPRISVAPRAGSGPGAGPAPSAGAGLPADAAVRSPHATREPTGDVMPRALTAWLSDMPAAPPPPAPAPAAAPAGPEAPKPPHRLLMYVLSAQGTELRLDIHLGNLRRTGEIGPHHVHSPSVADMLRNQPAYLADTDLAALAALLPMALPAVTQHIVLSGRHAAPALRALLATGRVWLVASFGDELPTPPGPPARWLDEPLSVSLHWQADPKGNWRAHWRGPPRIDGEDGQPLALVLLPEPLALDAAHASLRPADLGDPSLQPSVVEWLSRMPAVPAPALPQFIDRLQRSTATRRIAVPLPRTLSREGSSLGRVPLVPVLKLGTCTDVSSEALLHYRYGSAATRNTTARQACVQLLLRYRPAGAPAVDFHVPAVGAEGAFVELPDRKALARFERDGAAESAAVRTLTETLDMRPWSLAAGLVVNRLTRVTPGRLQDAAIPPAAEGQPLLLVPRQREQWSELLAAQLPALQLRGWVVEVEDDFPYELHNVDDWTVDIDEEPGRSDWFSVGLKVSVDGKPVELVPLLVSLVQSGWLKLDAALRQRSAARAAAATGEAEPPPADATDAADGGPHVLVPWPDDTPAPPGQLQRQRLLRLPVDRVAPLMDWLRTVFRAGDPTVPLSLSRFDLATLDSLASGARVTAPPSFTELVEQLRVLQSGQGLPEVTPSPHVHAVLRPYQLHGLAWLQFLRAYAAGRHPGRRHGPGQDRAGAGHLLQREGSRPARPARPRRSLPTSLLGNWQAEAARFAPAAEACWRCTGRERTQTFAQIGGARPGPHHLPAGGARHRTPEHAPLALLVLDEAQRIKNSRSHVGAGAARGCGARHRLCLTGTPLENHLGELWSLSTSCCPACWAATRSSASTYRNPIEKRRDTGAAELLARRVRPFILRRTKSQVAHGTAPKTEILLPRGAGGRAARPVRNRARRHGRQVRDAHRAARASARSQIMVLDALLKLRQVCCDPRLLKGPTAHAGARWNAPRWNCCSTCCPTLVEDGRRVLLFSPVHRDAGADRARAGAPGAALPRS